MWDTSVPAPVPTLCQEALEVEGGWFGFSLLLATSQEGSLGVWSCSGDPD